MLTKLRPYSAAGARQALHGCPTNGGHHPHRETPHQRFAPVLHPSAGISMRARSGHPCGRFGLFQCVRGVVFAKAQSRYKKAGWAGGAFLHMRRAIARLRSWVGRAAVMAKRSAFWALRFDYWGWGDYSRMNWKNSMRDWWRMLRRRSMKSSMSGVESMKISVVSHTS